MPPPSNDELIAARARLGALIDGKYRLISVIGLGGMGIVYEAEHLFLQRTVALKILHPRYEDTMEASRRFLKEARTVGSLGHPTIVQILDAGFVGGTTPYLVMELLRGENLEQQIARMGGLRVHQAAFVLRELMRGVAAAHAKGVIHCDLKPANVFIVDQAYEPNKVKILDFGISKVAEESKSSISDTGSSVLGTPDYMAPEQVQGANVDPRTDIYAAGIVIYEALSGAPPFTDRSRARVFMNILREPPPPIQGLREPVPQAFQNLIASLLGKELDQRPPHARAVIENLDRLQLVPSGLAKPSGSFIASKRQS
jgi:eukaryotic-like serine/threonine-protein kinase